MLKRIITITLLLFGITFTSFAQTKPARPGDITAKISKFYPSPATSNINFELVGVLGKSYTLQVYNFMGKKVYEITSASQRISLSLNNFFRGVYIFQLRDQGGKLIDSGRFQVVK